MRYLLILLIFSGCSEWEIRDDNGLICEGKTVRKFSVECGKSTIAAGEVAINNETVQALGKEAVKVVGAKQELE